MIASGKVCLEQKEMMSGRAVLLWSFATGVVSALSAWLGVLLVVIGRAFQTLTRPISSGMLEVFGYAAAGVGVAFFVLTLAALKKGGRVGWPIILAALLPGIVFGLCANAIGAVRVL